MGTAKADHANAIVADDVGETIDDPIDQPVSATPILLETLVDHANDNFEIHSTRERNTMLFDIGGVFCGIEVDCHAYL